MTKESAFGGKCLWKSGRVCSQTASTVQGGLFLPMEGRASCGEATQQAGLGPGPGGGDGDNVLAERPPQVPATPQGRVGPRPSAGEVPGPLPVTSWGDRAVAATWQPVLLCPAHPEPASRTVLLPAARPKTSSATRETARGIKCTFRGRPCPPNCTLSTILAKICVSFLSHSTPICVTGKFLSLRLGSTHALDLPSPLVHESTSSRKPSRIYRLTPRFPASRAETALPQAAFFGCLCSMSASEAGIPSSNYCVSSHRPEYFSQKSNLSNSCSPGADKRLCLFLSRCGWRQMADRAVGTCVSPAGRGPCGAAITSPLPLSPLLGSQPPRSSPRGVPSTLLQLLWPRQKG